MSEQRGSETIEILPGIVHEFSESGISSDVFNVWTPSSMLATMGDFTELKPIRHYGEYFTDQDAMYRAKGKPGLFDAVMQRSNPEAVAVFDRLVDEFNADLPRIKQEGDNEAVQAFFRRAAELRDKPQDR